MCLCVLDKLLRHPSAQIQEVDVLSKIGIPSKGRMLDEVSLVLGVRWAPCNAHYKGLGTKLV